LSYLIVAAVAGAVVVAAATADKIDFIYCFNYYYH